MNPAFVNILEHGFEKQRLKSGITKERLPSRRSRKGCKNGQRSHCGKIKEEAAEEDYDDGSDSYSLSSSYEYDHSPSIDWQSLSASTTMVIFNQHFPHVNRFR